MVSLAKVFWNDLAEILLNALKFSFEAGQLSISQTRGIVKLIPKKDAELILIKNWRPLTLLNCEYKIASKAIASRIKNFLPKLISDDQTGLLKGRCISENIRLLAVSSNIQQEKTGGEETRSGTEKRCSHNLQSGHPAWWSADNYSIFPTVNIFRLFRSKKRTGRGNQKCLKNWKK